VLGAGRQGARACAHPARRHGRADQRHNCWALAPAHGVCGVGPGHGSDEEVRGIVNRRHLGRRSLRVAAAGREKCRRRPQVTRRGPVNESTISTGEKPMPFHQRSRRKVDRGTRFKAQAASSSMDRRRRGSAARTTMLLAQPREGWWAEDQREPIRPPNPSGLARCGWRLVPWPAGWCLLPSRAPNRLGGVGTSRLPFASTSPDRPGGCRLITNACPWCASAGHADGPPESWFLRRGPRRRGAPAALPEPQRRGPLERL